MQQGGRGGGWGGPRGRGSGGGRGGARYTPAATLDDYVQKDCKQTPAKKTPKPTATERPTASVTTTPAASLVTTETGPAIYTVGYGGMKGTAVFLERLQSNGITRLLDIRISPHCGFNRDFTGRNMGPILRERGIEYEHFMELGNVWRSDDSEAEMDAPTRLRLYRELMSQAGELLTRRLRQRVEAGQGKERIAILCACGDVRECHRNIVATYLRDSHGFIVHHI